MLERFQKDGYAVIPAFKLPSEIARLRARAEAIVEAFDSSEGGAVFSTHDQAKRSNAYFLESAASVRCFFEEEAFDENGSLRVPKAQAINKIGHAMHDLDAVFDEFSHGAALAQVALAAGLQSPLLYQSMYIFKQPRIGGEVKWHQDASFFVTDPPSVTAFWFALEDANRDNGCLWIDRGGHRGPLRERFSVRDQETVMERLDPTPWPSLDRAVPLEVAAGTLVVFSGMLAHYSAPNRSSRSRHAYTLHAVDARARYAPENWLQRDPASLRGFDGADAPFRRAQKVTGK
ncbi:MAG: phytanoyl-CoA dioxygenase family protein [Candidatus Tyrphobacter sp.]